MKKYKSSCNLSTHASVYLDGHKKCPFCDDPISIKDLIN